METSNAYTIIIDLRQNTTVPRPHFTQNDTNIIEFEIRDNGATADLSNVERINVNYKRPDGKTTSRLVTPEDNVITYEFGSEEMAVPGYGEISLQFFYADQRLSTKKLKVYFGKSLGPHFENSAGMPLLQELFVEVAEMTTQTNDAAAYAMEKGTEADQAATDARTATEAANTATNEAVTATEDARAATEDASAAAGIANEAKETADRAETTANSVQTQFDQVVHRETDSDAMSAQATVDAEGNAYTTLKQRLDEKETNFTSQLADTTVYAPVPSAYWIAPAQPPARIDNEGYFINGFAGDADYYINSLFEPLRTENSDYITRQNLGKDQSGSYDIWRYDFTPKHYEKTIIITATLHGGEIQSTLAFYLFMKLVCEKWKDYPQLAYLRHKVRIISIPIANPWGVSQSPRVRANANGVNLNRNFDYGWSTYPTYNNTHQDYKGTAVWSEKEAQYVRDLVTEHSGAVAYLDLHALGSGSRKKAYMYSPRSTNVGKESKWVEFFNWFTNNGSYRWMMMEAPMSCNWAAETFGMYAATPEWVTQEWGTQTFDSVEMTKSTEFFGNILLMFAQEYKKPRELAPTEPVIHRANYLGSNPNALKITGNTYTPVPELALEFEVPTSGIVLLSGEISTKSDDPASISYIMPTVGQPGGWVEPGQLLEAYFGIYYEGDKRTTNPISGAFLVKPSNGDGTNKVKVQLWARTNLGTLSIYRYRMNALFIPSGRADAVKMYSATGKEGTGEGAMTIIANGFA